MTALDGIGAGTSDSASAAASEPGAAPRRSPTRLASFAVRLFPDDWQSRYGAEFGALLDATPPSIRIAFDVLVAAVDAHVHPTGPRRRWPLMIERLRISELTVFASWVVLVVAGLAFQRMTEGAPLAAIAAGQPAVGWAYAAIIGGAVVSLLAIAFGGVPIALAIGRTAVERRRWRQVGLLAVPPLSLAAWIGVTLLLIGRGDPVAGDPWRIIAFLAWVGTFVAAATASTVAVSAAALDADVDAALYRRAVAPSRLAAIAMMAVTAAVVAWGVALGVTTPGALWGSEGILGTSTILTWVVVAFVMTAATAVAVRAARNTTLDLAA